MPITESEAKVAIERLRALLDITLEEASRIYCVSRDTLVSWLNDQAPIPPASLELISQTDASLRRISGIIREANLPALVNRPALIFRGTNALDWILKGRIADVADIYDHEFSRQSD